MELFKLFGTIAISNSEANQAIDDTTGKAEGSSNKMVEVFKKVGKAVVTYFAVDKIIDFGKEIVKTSATVNAEMSAFEQIMGDYSDNAQTKMNEVADATGAVSTRLTPYMTSLTAKFKGLGYDIDEATTLASDGLMLASDASAFWDKSLDDSMSALNSFINGSYEGGEAIGLFANDTQMAQYAVQKGLVKSTKAWANLDEATKQATRLEYAKSMFEASGAVGQASKESEQYANVQANLTEKWRQFKAQIGEPLLENIVLPAMKKLSDVVDIVSQKFEEAKGWIEEFKNKIQEAKQWCEEHSTVLQILGVFVGGLTTAILAYNAVAIAKAIADGAMTLAIGAYCTATTIATTVTTAFGAVMAFLASPITIAIAIITALIAIGVLLYKNWDVIKEKAIELKDKVVQKITELKEGFVNKFNELKEKAIQKVNDLKSSAIQKVNDLKNGFIDKVNLAKDTVLNIFNKIKNGIKEKIDLARDTVKSAIDKIKSFFNFKWEFPKLKMPHFKIKGSFSLNPPSVPTLGVEWYKKAYDNPMILNSPTLFGYSNGKFLGGGDGNGGEVIVGQNTLLNLFKSAIREENSETSYVLQNLTNMLYDMLFDIISKLDRPIVLNDGTLISVLTPGIDETLGEISDGKARGR